MEKIPSRLSTFSWILYDFANTIFSMNIVSLYFALWVTVDMGGRDIYYSIANSVSMAGMVLTAPLLGAISDQARKRMPFLMVSTLICVLFTALLGLGGLIPTLFFFSIANYGFQAGLIFYDSLLPEVSREDNRGTISGIGIAVGYMGTIAGVLLVAPFADRYGNGATFLPSAFLFLIFAIPCFLFVQEKGRVTAIEMKIELKTLREAIHQTIVTLRHAQKYPGLLRFLLGRLFYADAVNTVIIFMSVYAVKTIGFTDGQVRLFLLASTVFAILGAFVCGTLVDRVGPKKALNAVLIIWATAFVGAILIRNRSLFWMVGFLAGLALGSTWASDRVYMLRLAPPRYLGEFYGLYSTVGRFATIIGPMLWGSIVFLLEDFPQFAQRAAIGSLLLMVIISFLILQGVSDHRREWSPEEV